jgi:hypothetical protein
VTRVLLFSLTVAECGAGLLVPRLCRGTHGLAGSACSSCAAARRRSSRRSLQDPASPGRAWERANPAPQSATVSFFTSRPTRAQTLSCRGATPVRKKVRAVLHTAPQIPNRDLFAPLRTGSV